MHPEKPAWHLAIMGSTASGFVASSVGFLELGIAGLRFFAYSKIEHSNLKSSIKANGRKYFGNSASTFLENAKNTGGRSIIETCGTYASADGLKDVSFY